MGREIRGTHARTRFGLSITPMIDVVFLLLVYFLLSSGLVSHERLLKTEAAAPERAQPRIELLALEVDPLVIGLSRSGAQTRILLPDGLAMVDDAPMLEAVLRGALLTPLNPNGMFASDHPVRIAPAPDVPWADVVGVFHATTRAGFRSIAFGGRP